MLPRKDNSASFFIYFHFPIFYKAKKVRFVRENIGNLRIFTAKNGYFVTI